jgi:multiple sugar transport system permease protein
MKEERIKLLLIWAGSLFVLLFSLTPFFYMIATSLSASPHYLSARSQFELTLEHYRSVLTIESLHFLNYLFNSLLISALTALFTILIASLAAYAITRLEWSGRAYALFFVLAVSMFPQISLISYLFRLMGTLGWINTYQALILPYIAWTLPLCLWILVSYFAQLPRDLDRAGLVDGCSRWQILRKVIYPVARPGLFSATLLAFIFAFNEFLFALMLTTDYRARTIPVGIALFEGLHGQIPWGEIMAAASLSTAPLAVLTLVFQRNIMQGLTMGAIKG